MAEARLEFDIAGHAESAVAAFGETAAAADGAARAVDRFARKQRETSAAAGDEAGVSFAQRFKARLESSFGESATGGGGILQGITGIATSSPEGFAAVAGGIAALATEATGLATGLAAAGAGMGAFFLLAHPVLSNLAQDYSQVKSAQDALQQAQDKYQIDPSKTTLKAVQAATLNLQAAQLGAKQDLGSAAGPVEKFAAALSKLQTAFQPVALKVFGDLITALTPALDAVGKLANAAAPALDSVAKSLGGALSGPGFRQFINEMASVAPVAIRQLGSLLGAVGADLAKFLSLMGKNDVFTAFRIAIDAVDTALKLMIFGVKFMMVTWDVAWDLMTGRVGKAGNAIHSLLSVIPGRIVHDLESLPGLLVHLGEELIGGLIRGIESKFGSLGSTVTHMAGSIISGFGHLLGISSPSTVFAGHGRNLVLGLVQGIDSAASLAVAAVGRLGAGLGSPVAGALAAQAGTGYGAAGNVLTLRVEGSGQASDEFLAEMIRRYVHAYGGGATNSVQIAYGTNY